MKNPIEENHEVNQGTEKYKLPRKKITENQEEMWNLIGNKRNANQNNNGIQFLTM